MQMEIVEEDISGLIGEKMTICMLQTKTPFSDECETRFVGGHNILVCDLNELRKRKNA